jgi:hypothetical protein
MRAYLKLLAVVVVTGVCFTVVRAPVARDLWLGQKWAWAQAYGSPADQARVQDECGRIWAEESGDPGEVELYEFGRRWRQVIALYVAGGATPSEAAALATEAGVREREREREREAGGEGCGCGAAAPARGADGTYRCSSPEPADGAVVPAARRCPRWSVDEGERPVPASERED